MRRSTYQTIRYGKRRYLKAQNLKRRGAQSYACSWATPHGAWTFNATGRAMDWAPFSVIRLLDLKDITYKI